MTRNFWRAVAIGLIPSLGIWFVLFELSRFYFKF